MKCFSLLNFLKFTGLIFFSSKYFSKKKNQLEIFLFFYAVVLQLLMACLVFTNIKFIISYETGKNLGSLISLSINKTTATLMNMVVLFGQLKCIKICAILNCDDYFKNLAKTYFIKKIKITDDIILNLAIMKSFIEWLYISYIYIQRVVLSNSQFSDYFMNFAFLIYLLNNRITPYLLRIFTINSANFLVLLIGNFSFTITKSFTTSIRDQNIMIKNILKFINKVS